VPHFLQGGAVQAVLLKKLPQGHFGDAELPGTRDEVEQLVARGLGMGEEELGDRAGMPRQQFSVRATAEMVVNLLAHLLGGEFLMAKRRAGGNADQACDLSDRQSHAAVKQKVTGDARSGVVSVAPLKELKRCVKNGTLFVAQAFRPNLCPVQPLFECLTFRGHANASLAVASPAAEV